MEVYFFLPGEFRAAATIVTACKMTHLILGLLITLLFRPYSPYKYICRIHETLPPRLFHRNLVPKGLIGTLTKRNIDVPFTFCIVLISTARLA